MSVCPTASLAECLRDGEEALRIAREMGWRSGEANALIILGLGLGPRGEFSHALEVAQSGLAIAVEIEHRVWMAIAHTLLGALHLDLLTLPAAQEHFEQALSLAKEIGSLTISNGISGFLASTYIAQHELVRAQSLLDTRLRPDTPTQTFGQRLLWCAQAELALAHDHPNTSLEIIDRLIASFAHGEDHGDRVVLPLWHLRGKALVALGRGAEAETALQAAQTVARKQGTRPFLWRLCVTLGKLYRSQARREQADEAFSEARAIIEGLAAKVADEAVRDNFLRSAMAQMPRLRTLSPRRAAKRAFEGLTEREREVAALVAEGKSNRALADELVVSERTIAKHVERIMTKLGVASRAQIAVWAVEKGLTKHTD
jgi:DNA-binding CsgD family transcriptional regulator